MLDGAIEIIFETSTDWKPFSPRLERTDLPDHLAADSHDTVARIKRFKELLEPRVRSLGLSTFGREFSGFARVVDMAIRTLDSALLLAGLGVRILGCGQRDASKTLGGLATAGAGRVSAAKHLWKLMREGVGAAYRECRTFLMTNEFSRTIGACYDSVWLSLDL